MKSQASIQFKISVGASKTSEHNTSQRTIFKENTKSDQIECFGGRPTKCPSWSAWSQTIAESPVPISYTLESLDVFLSGYNLERTIVDSSEEQFQMLIQNRVATIRQALKDYFDIIAFSLPPNMFASDATRNGVAPHITSIPIGGRGMYEGT